MIETQNVEYKEKFNEKGFCPKNSHSLSLSAII